MSTEAPTLCEDGEIDWEIDEAAWRLVTDQHTGSRTRCFICDCVLTGPVSISYGTCLECWREMVAAIHG
jgi:hypothetical protein